MKCRTVKILLLALLCVSALFLRPAAADEAAQPARETVRVGYSSSGSLLYRDDDGVYRGYDVLYLYEIARYTGWNFEFVPYDNWSKAIDDVRTGRIDILPTVLKTPEREKALLFSQTPMGSTNIALIARPGDPRYVYGDLSTVLGARIGVRMGSADAKAFQGWAEKNALNYNPVPYQDRGDLLAALRAGDIDLAATSYVGDTQKFPAIAKFAPQLMYFAITPAKPQLAAQLNQAMSNILLYNASFPDALEKVTKPDKGLYPVLVSEKEKELIRNLPPLRVALSVHDAPFSYEHDGELRGIAIRVLDRIAELTGLQFTYVPAENAADARALLANGEADMASGMTVNHIKAQEQDFRMTTPYYQDHMAYLIRRGHEAQHIAVSAENRAARRRNVP